MHYVGINTYGRVGESSQKCTDGVDQGPFQSFASWGCRPSGCVNLPRQPYLLPRDTPARYTQALSLSHRPHPLSTLSALLKPLCLGTPSWNLALGAEMNSKSRAKAPRALGLNPSQQEVVSDKPGPRAGAQK